MVVAMTAFMAPVDDVADVLLPIAPFTETSGTFVNAEGPRAERPRRRQAARRRAAGVEGAARARQPARPGRLLVRDLGGGARRGARRRRDDPGAARRAARRAASDAPAAAPARAATLERIADVPIYAVDPIVRRAPALQLHRRCAAAGGRRAERARRRARHRRRRRWCASARAAAQVVLPARVDPSLAAERGPRRRRRIRSPPRSGRCSARSTIDVVADGRRRCRDRVVARGDAVVSFDAITSYGSGLLGGYWPVVWTVTQDRRPRRAAAPLRRLPDALGAQGDRLEPDPPRARTGSARSACCSRSPTPSS